MPFFRLLLLSLSFSSLPLAAEILAEFQQGAITDSHLARLPALFVPSPQPATPLLKPGPFTVTWTGTLELEKRQRLHFSFAGTGTAALAIDGEEVLQESGQLGESKSERLRLNSGSHPFTLTYQSPPDQAARFQLHWEERAFPREPIPPSAFGKGPAFHPSNSESNLASHGRELFARHLCSKCHLPQDGFGPHAPPELTHTPPILALTGNRLQQDWLADWLYNPTAFRPDTNMPRLLPQTEEGRQQAADLAAYLMTLKTETTAPTLNGSAQDGGALFHQLACITCHGLPNDSQPSNERIPLAHLNRKFQPHALRDFLLNPSQLAPHTRMPNFRLSEKEANSLTTYLLENSNTPQKTTTASQGDATKGKTLAAENHCGACHAGLPYDSTALPPFEAIVKKSWQTAPCYQSESSHLNLPATAGPALEALRSQHLDSLRHDTPSSFVERQIRNLRCHACHSQDEQTALLSSLHPESAALTSHLPATDKLDQSLPALTHVGAKLHTTALAQILQGTAQPRARPWLDARMPSFSNFAPQTFAAGLAAQHGLPTSQPTKSEANPESTSIGKKLISSQGGFGCTTCHGVGDIGPTAAFEVMGINFDRSHQRLREDFYYRWMHDPTRIDPATKMPRYADEDSQTPLPEFNNDSHQQFQAIWHYLQTQPPKK